MIGITSYGAYIPYHRMPRSEVSKAWANPALMGPGEVAIRNFDEDSLSMAVEASIDCLTGMDRKAVDGFFLASTTLSYKEKMVSTIGAQALDLRPDIRTADFASSLRVGVTALLSAMDGIKAGSMKNVLVAAADGRPTQVNSELEITFGDGAAAIMLGDNGVAATIECTYSLSDEFTDLYRGYDDSFVRMWEDRFTLDEGYRKILPQAITELLKKCNLTPQDITKAVYYGPNGRRHREIARVVGFTPEQVQDPLFNDMGNTGTALPLMMLVAALEEAKAGDTILLAGYGNGCDAILLKVTDEIEKIRDRRGIKVYLASKKQIPSYERLLIWRELVPLSPMARPEEAPISASAMWRERKQNISLYGGKCKSCGYQQYPPQRVCVMCHAKDNSEPVRLSDKKATVFTFTIDYLAMANDPPVVTSYVDIEGGGRCQFELTDREAEEVAVGMPVEFTFRRLHYNRGINNYWWKIRPPRGG